jgi:hypothetical protein
MKRKSYERNRKFAPGFSSKQSGNKNSAVWGDRQVMVSDLLKLGLNEKLLDALSNRKISELFQLIGWAAPVFEKAEITEKGADS